MTEQKQILIAEDEPNIVLSLKYVLERAGYTVETTSDGAQVESKSHSMAPDLIILDIMLPNKSGFDVLKGLRANRSTSDIPVLVLTARGREDDRTRATELGATDFTSKPYSNSKLVGKVRKLLGHS